MCIYVFCTFGGRENAGGEEKVVESALKWGWEHPWCVLRGIHLQPLDVDNKSTANVKHTFYGPLVYLFNDDLEVICLRWI